MIKGEKRPDLQKARIGLCKVCGKEFRAVKDYRTEKHVNEQKYCSKACWNVRAVKKIEVCKYCGKDFEVRDSTKTRKRVYCSRDCGFKDMVGEKAPRYKDGKSLDRERARKSGALSAWRKGVYEKDGYSCKECGIKGNIHAHHILSWAEYPDFRFDVSNGITLCEKCHGELHNKNFENRRNKICPFCGCKTKGSGKLGMCRSCSITQMWANRKKGE